MNFHIIKNLNIKLYLKLLLQRPFKEYFLNIQNVNQKLTKLSYQVGHDTGPMTPCVYCFAAEEALIQSTVNSRTV